MKKEKPVKLLYAAEHYSCYNYSQQNSLLSLEKIQKDEVFDLDPSQNGIVFVLRGKVLSFIGMEKDRVINGGEMFVLPKHLKGKITAIEDSVVLLMRLDMNLFFCEHFSLEKLCRETDLKPKEDLFLLKINSVASFYFDQLERYIEAGLKCSYFFELKVKEFLYILRAFYTKEELKNFFLPILNLDTEFTLQVQRKVEDAKSVKELADSLNYSVSGFEKRFKKVFNMPASKWIELKKSRSIYHEINCSNKTIAEIAYDFHFSPSQFNDYCKRIFKKTPKQLRKDSDE